MSKNQKIYNFTPAPELNVQHTFSRHDVTDGKQQTLREKN